jgi:signal transduction histidine kinase
MPREAETFLSLIERNTRLEARLVHDLVDMARISAGKLSVDLQTTYLRSTVEMVIDSMQLRLDEKRISIQFEKLGPDRLVLGDPERLQQIVSNLLSNAVKFTNDGGWINVCLDRENSSQVELRVSDSGIGMDDKLIADVFTPFRQGDTGQRRSGLGLGLAIVKSLVELHGGTVQAYSEGVGKGSTFVVRVPVAEAADAVQFDTAVV